jgi:hypothetical protein
MKHLFGIRWFNAMHWSPMHDAPRFRVRHMPSSAYFRASLWIDWRWRGRGHWLLIWLPDFMP